MKIEITIPNLTSERLRWLGATAVVVCAVVLWVEYGFAAWLLLLAFSLLLVAIGLLWTSVTTMGEDPGVSLDEALDLAAPARDEERKLAVLRGIKDLEYERGLGKVSEQDYQQLSQRFRHEAKRLLARLDTSESSIRKKAIDLAASTSMNDRTSSASPPAQSPPAAGDATKGESKLHDATEPVPGSESRNTEDQNR